MKILMIGLVIFSFLTVFVPGESLYAESRCDRVTERVLHCHIAKAKYKQLSRRARRNCSRAERVYNNKCAKELYCVEVYQPVCGQVGKLVSSFPNSCYALKYGATILSEGLCLDH